MKLRPMAQQAYLKMLIESISGDGNAAAKETEKLSQELERAGSDADEVEIQAAMLGALIDADGDIAAIDVSDVEKIKQDIEESRDYRIDESGGGYMAYVHGALDVLGNTALTNAIVKKVEEITGKELDAIKIKTKIEQFAAWLKKVTGWPAKKMEQFFSWVAKKFGASAFTQKIAGYAGTLVTITAMFIFGIVSLPHVSASFGFIFALGGLLGKGTEMITMIKEIIHAVREEMEKNASAADQNPRGSVFS